MQCSHSYHISEDRIFIAGTSCHLTLLVMHLMKHSTAQRVKPGNVKFSENKLFKMTEVLFLRCQQTVCSFQLFQPTVSAARMQEVGPAALTFEISGSTPSNLQIRFLRVFDREHSYVPMRWVRYITTTDSYVFKL